MEKLKHKLRLSDLKPLWIGLEEYKKRCVGEMNSLENLKRFNRYSNRTFALGIYNNLLMYGTFFLSKGLGEIVFGK